VHAISAASRAGGNLMRGNIAYKELKGDVTIVTVIFKYRHGQLLVGGAREYRD
jgi:hypothetical protein